MEKKKSLNIGNFGKGWIVIIFSFIVFFFYGALCQDSLNILVPVYSANMNVSEGILFTLTSYAGIIAIFIHIALGQVLKRIGAKKTIAIALVLGAIAFIVEAHTSSRVIFIIARAVLTGCTTNAAYVGCGTLVATYFPRLKGITMGYVTMGLNLNSAIIVAVLSALLAALGGIGKVSFVFAICLVILAVIAMLVIKAEPTQMGMYPDNVSEEVYKAEYVEMKDGDSSNYWTVKRLLKTPMVYSIAITTGIFGVCVNAVITNMVARNMEMGMTMSKAALMMTIIAIVGLVGSWGIGIIDEKLGTKRAMIVYGFIFFLAGLLNWIAGMTGAMLPLYISIFGIGVGIGGASNFFTSLPCSVFGRRNFDQVQTVVFPMQSVLLALGFLIVGLIRIITNNNLMWIFFAAGILALADIVLILILIKNERMYNEDFIEG